MGFRERALAAQAEREQREKQAQDEEVRLDLQAIREDAARTFGELPLAVDVDKRLAFNFYRVDYPGVVLAAVSLRRYRLPTEFTWVHVCPSCGQFCRGDTVENLADLGEQLALEETRPIFAHQCKRKGDPP